MAAEERSLIAFDQPVESTLRSDAEFFAHIEWEKSVPARFRNAARAGDFAHLVEFVMKTAAGSRLGKQSSPPTNGALLSLWAGHEAPESESDRSATLRRALDMLAVLEHRTAPKFGAGRNSRKKTLAADFIAVLERGCRLCAEGPPLSSLERLFLFEILRDAGEQIPSSLAGTLWRIALASAIEQAPRDRNDSDTPAGERLIADELNWQAGLLFSPVSGAAKVAAAAREELGRMLLESSDQDGVPSAELVGELPDLLATLVRAREWGRRFARPFFDKPQEKRFRALVSIISRLCRGDGGLPFTNGEANGICSLWSAAAVSIAGRQMGSSRALAYLHSLGAASGRRLKPTRTKNCRSGRLSKGSGPSKGNRPVCQSDGSRLACLRNKWVPDANLLSVLHHGRFPKLELATRGNVLISGDWELEVCVAGRELPLAAPWICSCWYTDDEGDYLELQAHLTPETRVERQLLLARNDDLLFLADAVIGGGEVRIDYASRLPLVPGVEARSDHRTRECRLLGRTPHARVFPIGLPCERIQGTAGHFSASPSCLELRQSGIGGLYAPVLLDWNPARRRSPAVWRLLTVAQDGAALSSGRAVGYRVRTGKEQWLVYRSLSRILEPRTVLGQHTLYETMIGRFLRSGTFEPMVLVEQRPENANEP